MPTITYDTVECKQYHTNKDGQTVSQVLCSLPYHPESGLTSVMVFPPKGCEIYERRVRIKVSTIRGGVVQNTVRFDMDLITTHEYGPTGVGEVTKCAALASENRKLRALVATLESENEELGSLVAQLRSRTSGHT